MLVYYKILVFQDILLHFLQDIYVLIGFDNMFYNTSNKHQQNIKKKLFFIDKYARNCIFITYWSKAVKNALYMIFLSNTNALHTLCSK